MTKCDFCTNSAVQKRAIIRTDLAWAVPGYMPITPGHTLVLTKRCVAKIDELTRKEKVELLNLLEDIKKALKKSFNASGFNIAWNEGEMAGQSVPHLHIHVIPRSLGDTGITSYEPRKFLYRPGSREKSSEKELQMVARLIKKHL